MLTHVILMFSYLQLLENCSWLFGADDYQMTEDPILSTGLPLSHPFSQSDVALESNHFSASDNNYHSGDRVPVRRSTSKG